MTRSRLGSLSIAAWISFALATEIGEVGSGGAGLGNGVSVRIVTRLQPPGKNFHIVALSNRYSVRKGVLHRFLVDPANRTFFGYDLSGEPLAGTSSCRVAIGPLTSVQADGPASAPARGSAGATAGGAANSVQIDGSFRAVLLPKYPDPQVVSTGDTIVLELLTSPDGKQKLVDSIEVKCQPPQMKPETHGAKDFSLDDLEIHLSNPVLRINDEVITGAQTTHIGGKLIWLYVPGQGRFVLSPVPRTGEGFLKCGVIRGNVAEFEIGGRKFDLRSGSPILTTTGTWSLFIFHEPTWRGGSRPAFGSASGLAELTSEP